MESQEINTLTIADKLKYIPKGFKLYSPILGEVSFECVTPEKTIVVLSECNDHYYNFDEYGRFQMHEEGDCCLFPSKEIRDWDNFYVGTKKYYRLKAFDKVIVRNSRAYPWKADIYSHHYAHEYICVGGSYRDCLIYNEETAKLLGTVDNYDHLI